MTTANELGRPVHSLLVEDNPGDVELTKQGLKEGKVSVHLDVVVDGAQAMAFLRQQGRYTNVERPDIVLLDLNLPGKDGREVLAEIRNDSELETIPIAVLTTSDADEDILQAYKLKANCYITKPVDFDQFVKIVHQIKAFWFTIVSLPSEI